MLFNLSFEGRKPWPRPGAVWALDGRKVALGRVRIKCYFKIVQVQTYGILYAHMMTYTKNQDGRYHRNHDDLGGPLFFSDQTPWMASNWRVSRVHMMCLNLLKSTSTFHLCLQKAWPKLTQENISDLSNKMNSCSNLAWSKNRVQKGELRLLRPRHVWLRAEMLRHDVPLLRVQWRPVFTASKPSQWLAQKAKQARKPSKNV